MADVADTAAKTAIEVPPDAKVTKGFAKRINAWLEALSQQFKKLGRGIRNLFKDFNTKHMFKNLDVNMPFLKPFIRLGKWVKTIFTDPKLAFRQARHKFMGIEYIKFDEAKMIRVC